jgi:ribose transport system substrate-binding protein
MRVNPYPSRSRLRISIAIAAAAALVMASVALAGADRAGTAKAAGQICVWTSPQHLAKHCMAAGATPTIINIPACTEFSFFVDAAKGVTAAGKAVGAKASTQGPKTCDPNAQRPVIESVLASKPDAVLIDPDDARSLNDLITSFAKQGTVVATGDGDVADHSLRIFHIGSIQDETGYLAGLSLGSALNGKGTVLACSSFASNPIDSLRMKGFALAMKKFPGIKVMTQYCSTDPTKAASVASAALQAHPEINGMFGSGEPILEGEATAIQQAGKQGKIIIGGLDASAAEVHELRTKVIDFLVIQQPYIFGYEGIRLLNGYLKGAAKANSPLLPKGASGSKLPDIVPTGFIVAVNDKKSCPSLTQITVPGYTKQVVCGMSNDPKIAKWYY